MKYYTKEEFNTYLNRRNEQVQESIKDKINILFCNNCPFFERNYWQPDPYIEYGYCRARSYLGDEPFYVHTNNMSFCDAVTVLEDQEVDE